MVEEENNINIISPERSVLSSEDMQRFKYMNHLLDAERDLMSKKVEIGSAHIPLSQALDRLRFCYSLLKYYSVITEQDRSGTEEHMSKAKKTLNELLAVRNSSNALKEEKWGFARDELLLLHDQVQKLGHKVFGEPPIIPDLDMQEFLWNHGETGK